AAEDRDRIFERFVKLDPTRPADGGAGLGLSIARWVAEAHGGTLTLTESGQGRTTFEAHLPHAHPAG
ncbi:MAG: ATP-binding protein, partial [Vicinamibacterales bacterium]